MRVKALKDFPYYGDDGITPLQAREGDELEIADGVAEGLVGEKMAAKLANKAEAGAPANKSYIPVGGEDKFRTGAVPDPSETAGGRDLPAETAAVLQRQIPAGAEAEKAKPEEVRAPVSPEAGEATSAAIPAGVAPADVQALADAPSAERITERARPRK